MCDSKAGMCVTYLSLLLCLTGVIRACENMYLHNTRSKGMQGLYTLINETCSAYPIYRQRTKGRYVRRSERKWGLTAPSCSHGNYDIGPKTEVPYDVAWPNLVSATCVDDAVQVVNPKGLFANISLGPILLDEDITTCISLPRSGLMLPGYQIYLAVPLFGNTQLILKGSGFSCDVSSASVCENQPMVKAKLLAGSSLGCPTCTMYKKYIFDHENDDGAGYVTCTYSIATPCGETGCEGVLVTLEPGDFTSDNIQLCDVLPWAK